jgi:hypothetical protein
MSTPELSYRYMVYYTGLTTPLSQTSRLQAVARIMLLQIRWLEMTALFCRNSAVPV